MSIFSDQSLFSSNPDSPSKNLFSADVWKILIVDDESIMHSVTELVLRDFKFEGMGVSFLSAYSSSEAKALIREHPDIAVALIDIVMEEDNSGLQLIRWIREEQKNGEIRLILRTGQPGLAPERDIIQRYEINDYKEKTELTDVKLITSLTVAIRGFRDIHVLNRNRKGLQQILSGGSEIWSSESTQQLLSVVNHQFQIILAGEYNRELTDSFILQVQRGKVMVRLGSGNDSFQKGASLDTSDMEEFSALLEKCRGGDQIVYDHPYLACALNTRQEEGLFIITKTERLPDKTDHMILSAFLMNASLAMDYIILSASRTRSQRNMLYFLSEVIEQHFSETGNHIRRVSEMVYILSIKLGINEDLAENWKMASILHDLGKIGIPDHILKKPGKLTESEMEIMKSHVLIGYRMLSSNEDEFFPDAASIALSHHERWDGTGYPNGLQGESIPLPARILSVVDVFDALTHIRIYKEAWDIQEALNFICDKRGADFDPSLVKLFLENFDAMKGILDEYPD